MTRGFSSKLTKTTLWKPYNKTTDKKEEEVIKEVSKGTPFRNRG
jgi:hypothetical protein